MYFSLRELTSPHLLAAPCTQALSKVPLLPLPQLSTPTKTWLHPGSPQRPAESSLRGMHWSRQQERAAANFPQPTEATARAPPWTATLGDTVWRGADPHRLRPSRGGKENIFQRVRARTCFLWAPCKVIAFPGEQ